MVNNTKYGTGALENNTGQNNTGIGAYTGYNNLAGFNNTAVGSNSAFFNTTGDNNTSLGAGSLCNNTIGSLNTAIGSSALEGVSSVGNQNTAVGAQALFSNEGDLNTAIGTYAALGVTGGNYNTFLGANSSTLNNTSYNYSTAIGYNAQIDASNEIMMGGMNSGIYPNVIIPGKAFLPNFNSTGLQETQIVPKSYIDLVAGGLKATETCLCATTADISTDIIGNTAPSSNATDGVSLSSLADGSYNILVICQNNSGLTDTQTLDVSNGVWVFRKTTGPTYTWNRPIGTAPMSIGFDAAGAFSFVEIGSIYGKSALVQIYKNPINDLAIVGTDPLKYQIFYQLNVEAGRGLSTEIINQEIYVNVDTSLNFINFLDSNTGVTGANGTLALGTYTTNAITIGPTGTSVPIQAQSIIQAQKGITGATGSFINLGVLPNNDNKFIITDTSNVLIQIREGFGGSVAIGGENANLTNSTLYTTAVGQGACKSLTTGLSNTALGLSALKYVTSGSNNNGIGYSSLFGIKTGYYNVGIGHDSGNNGYDSSGNTFIGALTNISGPNINYSTALGYNAIANNSNQIMLGGSNLGVYPQVVAPGGITGATGSFTYLNASNTAYVQDLYVNGQHYSPGGITGATGSFTYLSVNDISAGRIDVYDLSVNHLATIGTTTTNLASNFITTSGTINAGGLITAQGGITGPTGSFNAINSNEIIINDNSNTAILRFVNQTGVNYIETYTPSATNAPLYLTNKIGANTYMSIIPNAGGTTANIGINKLNPSKTLDVSGNINFNGNITGPTGSFTNLLVSQQILAPGGITGATGSFTYLNSSNTANLQDLYVNGQHYAPGGLTGGTGAFTYLSSSNNTYLATTNGTRVGIGNKNPASTLDVSGNLQISGKIVNGLTVDGGVTINGSGSGGGAPLLNINNSSGSSRFEFADEATVFGSKPALIFEDGYGGQIVTGAPGASIEIQTTWIDSGGQKNPQYAGYISIYPYDPNLGIYISGNPNNSGYPNVPIGNVGIHNTSPQYVLDVSGNARFSDITFIGPTSNPTNTLGILKVELAGANLLVYKDASNNYTSLVNTGGNTIEIGSTSFSNNLVITGTTTSTSFNTSSDYRLKENIENLDDNYSVDNLRPVYYNNKKTKQKDIGLIAHELQEHYPFLVNGEKDGNEFQSVNYNGLIGILIKEIKELKKRVKVLEDKQSCI